MITAHISTHTGNIIGDGMTALIVIAIVVGVIWLWSKVPGGKELGKNKKG